MDRPPLLRQRVRTAMVLLAAAAVVLFGVPLAVALQRVVTGQAVVALQRDATRAVALVPDNTLEAATGLVAPRSSGDTRIGVYDGTGRRLAGHGPPRSRLAALAGDGKEHDGQESGELVVVSPVLSDTAVAGSVRASVPLALLRGRLLRAWAALAGLAALVLGVTALLARRAARRIAEPFEQLTVAAQTLGAGSFEIALPRWGLAEADAAGAALQESARRLGELVRHERDFVRHASHQLRTPLAGLVVQLEQLQAGREPAAAEALDRAHHLERTIEDLLSVRAAAGHDSCDAVAVAREAVARWGATTGRPVVLRADEVDPAGLSAAALRQALDVLLDNALRHGDGAATVTVEPVGGSVAVEVADQGPGFTDDAVPGTGLRLAAALVERSGGDLLVRRRAPHPRVALLLPSRPAGQSSSNR